MCYRKFAQSSYLKSHMQIHKVWHVVSLVKLVIRRLQAWGSENLTQCQCSLTHTNSQIRVNFVTTFTDMSDLKALNDIHAVHLTAVLCLASSSYFVYKIIFIRDGKWRQMLELRPKARGQDRGRDEIFEAEAKDWSKIAIFDDCECTVT